MCFKICKVIMCLMCVGKVCVLSDVCVSDVCRESVCVLRFVKSCMGLKRVCFKIFPTHIRHKF